MDVRNCKMCGAIFNFDGSPLCPKCRRKMEEKFSVVKEYILKNPSFVGICFVSESFSDEVNLYIMKTKYTSFKFGNGKIADSKFLPKPFNSTISLPKYNLNLSVNGVFLKINISINEISL